MDPQYASTTQNQFDFLNQQPVNQKKPLMTGGNQKQRMLVFGVFVLVVLLLVVVAVVVFRNLTKKDYSAYKDLVGQQTEIVRIASAGTAKARDTSVKNYAATIASVTQSEKNDTLTFAKKVGVSINEKELDSAKDASNDKALAAAESSNQYDQKLVDLLNSLIVTYQKDIQAVAGNVTTKSEKAVVVKLQANAKVIANTKAQ